MCHHTSHVGVCGYDFDGNDYCGCTWERLPDIAQQLIFEPENKPKGPYYPSFCTCGRFAKFLASGVRYNGYEDTYWVRVYCSRCGEVTYD